MASYFLKIFHYLTEKDNGARTFPSMYPGKLWEKVHSPYCPEVHTDSVLLPYCKLFFFKLAVH